MFPRVTKLAKILGPMGVMPTVKKGTVTDDIESVLGKMKGLYEYKCEEDGILRCIIGKKSHTDGQIFENITSILANIRLVASGHVRKGIFFFIFRILPFGLPKLAKHSGSHAGWCHR